MFTFVRVRLALSLRRASLPPFHLFSLAAALEESFRSSSADHRPAVPDDDSCSPYQQLYGRCLPADPSAVKRFQKPSPPLILTPPVLQPSVPKGTILTLDAVLVGTAALQTDNVLRQLIHLLEQDYDAAIRGLTMIGLHDQQEICLSDVRSGSPLPLSIVSFDDLFRQLEGSGDDIRIRIRTPLKLVKDGRPLRQPGAPDFLRALCRRVSSLAYHYSRYEFEVDYTQLSEQAGAISWEAVRFNGRSSSFEGTLGLSGDIRLTGDLAPFYPFLAAGAVCHVGKGAAGGYGCYDILAAD